ARARVRSSTRIPVRGPAIFSRSFMEGLTYGRNILNWRLEVKRIGIAKAGEIGQRASAISEWKRKKIAKRT
ncbi:MAG: hypothetical protein QME78_00430, partial [Thermodesulfobacteriota bacterium]|nr:hypothetical protein [Thermodesulfobacteriota bacterium]